MIMHSWRTLGLGSAAAAMALMAAKIVTVSALLGLAPQAVGTAVSAEMETPVEIIAAQIRDQGYTCDKPKSAERDLAASKADSAVWILQCESETYRVRLVPDMAAKVERID